jgi:hypothetical protein
MASPLVAPSKGFLPRLGNFLRETLRRPGQLVNTKLKPGLSRRGTALMVMQTENNYMKLRLGRGLSTLFRRGLVAEQDWQHCIPCNTELGYSVARRYAEIGGDPGGSLLETLLNTLLPHTCWAAAASGGMPERRDRPGFQVFSYRGCMCGWFGRRPPGDHPT